MADAFETGRRVAARYVLEEQLGRGGLATAWRAHDLVADEPVTLKLLRGADLARVEALHGEFERLRGIEHPRLIRVRDFGLAGCRKTALRASSAGRAPAPPPDSVEPPEGSPPSPRDESGAVSLADPSGEFCGGLPERGEGGGMVAYYAAAHAQGETFERWRIGRSWSQVRLALVDALHALAFLHGLGIRHGDFKPSNIIVDDQGRATLIDLSAAASLHAPTVSFVAGTRGFVAPEVLEGGPVDARSDLFAVGATLARVRSGASSAWPASLDPLVERLTAASPADRPSSVGEVLEALGAEAELAPPAGVPPRLVGRDAELRTLRSFVDAFLRAEEGPRTIEVVGADGVGRTRVLQEIKWYLQSRCRVVEGRAEGRAPVASMLGRAGGGADPRGHDEVLEMRDRLARATSTVLLLDDAHRLGGPSRALFKAVVRGAQPTERLLVLAASREPLGAAVCVPLEPLSPRAVEQWVEGRVSEVGVAQLHRISGGYPTALRRVLARMSALGLSEGDLQSLPAIGEPMADEKLRGLDPAACRALAWVATSSSPAASPPSELRAALLELQRLGWLRRQEAGWQLAWPRQREAMLAALDEAVVREAHRAHGRAAMAGVDMSLSHDGPGVKAASAMAERSARCARAVEHLALAGEATRAGQVLTENVAAVEHAPRAWVRPSNRLASGAGLGRPVMLAVASVLELAGAPHKALRVLAGLRRGASTPEVAAIRAQAASASLKAGRPAAAERHARRALRAPSDEVGEAVRGRASVALAHAAIQQGAYTAALDTVRGALEVGVDSSSRSRLLEARALACTYTGDLALARAAIEAARSTADASPRARVRLASYDAIIAYAAGDLARAEAGYAEALEVARDAGLDDQLASALVNLGTVQQRRGDWGAAEQSYERGLRAARVLEKQSTELTSSINLANLYALMGLFERAHAMVQKIGEPSGVHGCTVAIIEGDLALARRDLQAAKASYRRAFEQSLAVDAHRERVEAHLQLAEVAVEAGALAEAEMELERAAELLSRHEAEDLAIRLALARGALALAHQEPGAAREQLARAVSLAEGSGELDLHGVALARSSRGYARAGAPALAEREAERARRTWERIALTLPSEAREAFWRHPARHSVRREVSSDEQAARGLRRLLDINRRLNSSLQAQEVLETALDAAIELAGAERGFILLRGEDDAFEVAVARNVDREKLLEPHFEFSRRIANQVIETGESVLTHDAGADVRFEGNESVHAMRLKSVLAAPIRTEQTLGALYLDHRHRSGRFDPADAELLVGFADQVAIALSNARLVEELRQKTRLLEAQARDLEAHRVRIQELAARQSDAIGHLEAQVRGHRRAFEGRTAFGEVLGRSAPMQELFALLDRVAGSPLDVLIRGESGTGKELIARALHTRGSRREGPFVAVNCAAIPETLLESELFGHRRGAFTGADRDREGLFVAASGGTLLLDEVGEMPLSMQARLLRTLQEREVRPVGASRSVPIDVRLLCATHRDLRARIADGSFREDLFYRVAVVEVRVPPLRERADDIALLAEAILERLAAEYEGTSRRLSSAALRRLEAHAWPGNVRELDNALRRAWVMSEGRVIDVDAFELVPDDAPELRSVPLEKARIRDALEQTGWNVSEVSRRLAIPRNTLYRRLKRYGLDRPPRDSELSDRGE